MSRSFDLLIGSSRNVLEMLELCDWYARADRPVVLVGPIGSGKTSLARLIHERSGRRGQFVAVSVGELTDTLYADVLFGHVAGAYTGAAGSRKGAMERAANGTLLFDDLAFMARPAQAALLRALESRSFLPLGAEREIPLTSREIFGSTKPPSALVADAHLVPDLASRLGELIVSVPGLAERLEDVPDLVRRFTQDFLREHDRPRNVAWSNQAMDLLLAYPWPGNIRELKGIVERGVLHALESQQMTVGPWHLPERIAQVDASDGLTPAVVQHAVREAQGNRSEAARRLGVHRNTIRRYL